LFFGDERQRRFVQQQSSGRRRHGERQSASPSMNSCQPLTRRTGTSRPAQQLQQDFTPPARLGRDQIRPPNSRRNFQQLSGRFFGRAHSSSGAARTGGEV